MVYISIFIQIFGKLRLHNNILPVIRILKMFYHVSLISDLLIPVIEHVNWRHLAPEHLHGHHVDDQDPDRAVQDIHLFNNFVIITVRERELKDTTTVTNKLYTVCPRSSDPIYVVTYYKK